MNDRFVRERWLVGSLLLGGVLLFLAGTLDAAVSKPASAPDPTDGKVRVICFGAHPDDNEFRAGGVAAMWAAQGHHVKFVSCTNGDIGHWGMAGGPLAQRRTAEVERCAEIFGIETEVLDIHDGEIMPTLENRKTIVRLIREWRADIVMCHRPNDYHPDHRYAALLVQDAGYMVTVPFFCPDIPYLKSNPVFLYYQDRFQKPNPFSADIAVGIDAVIDKKLEAALALASQTLEGGCGGSESLYPEDPTERKAREQEVRRRFDSRFADTANQFREQLTHWYGQEQAKNIKYAEAFEICEYGRRPSKKEIQKLFPFFPSL
ncbi:MAG: PIG-L family deacetylase [Sedimentisphaerales bacterium]